MSATKRFLLMLQTRAKANPSMSTRALQEQQEQAEARLCVRGHWHMLARALMLPPFLHHGETDRASSYAP